MNVQPYEITMLVERTVRVQANSLHAAQELGRMMAEEDDATLKSVEQWHDHELYNEGLRG